MTQCASFTLPRLFTTQEEDALCGHRRWLHANPELAFKELRTSDYVTTQLESFGLTPERGLAGTGVVATVVGQTEGRSVGLRADMDALPVLEMTGLAHGSRHEGIMHACGHDGHTAMLLGAAKLLSEDRDFPGKIHLVFQPAEEQEGGGRVMVEDGLFDRYPMDAIFAIHNWPGLAKGHVAVMPGPMMASFDVFDITLRGAGGHSAMPHKVDDVVVCGSGIVTALQTIVSRRLDPMQCGVMSITQVNSGSAYNVLADTFVLRGSCRTLSSAVQDEIESSMHRIVGGIASAFNIHADVRYERRLPATINDPNCATLAAVCAEQLFGSDRVHTGMVPSMASEDFSFMLQRCRGAYLWLGIGEQHAPLHSSHYDFEDGVIADGSRLLATLALTALREGK
ncbi:M20 aminoacylase family protein [Paraburkholderia sp. IW21]|uniref:M20 aminoacylase family protein n=1 Tax=Paraburkholderia sp. IW21 TaxID=3242488 RepID=UPI00351FC1D4